MKQSYCYTVLLETVKTLQGSQIVRNFKDSGDAQAAFRALLATFHNGIAADIEKGHLEDKIKALKVTDSTSEPLVTHLLKFANLLVDWQELRGDEDPISDHDKKRLLEESIRQHTGMYSEVLSLRRVNNAMAANSANKINDSYEALYDHLMAYAITEDDKRKTTSRQKRQVRTQQHHVMNDKDKQKRREIMAKFQLPFEEWKKLSRDQQKTKMRARDAAMRKAGVAIGREKYTTNELTNSQKPPTATTNIFHIRMARADAQNPSTFRSMVNQAMTEASGMSGTPVTSAQSTSRSQAPGAFISHILSGSAGSKTNGNSGTITPSTGDETVEVQVQNINGVTWYAANNINYRVKSFEADSAHAGSLIDGGANGPMAGDDMRIMGTIPGTVIDVTAACDSTHTDLPSQIMSGYVLTHKGPVIVFASHYAGYNKGHTIHSKGQLESFGCKIDDTSRAVGGSQRIITPDGYIIPLSIRRGLPYMDVRPPTDEELESDEIPHVWLTADEDKWDPTILDNEYTAEHIDDAESALEGFELDPTVNDYGEPVDLFDAELNKVTSTEQYKRIETSINEHKKKTRNISERTYTKYDYGDSLADYEALQPNFLHVPKERIRNTLRSTTQFFRANTNLPFRKHFRSRFPGANVFRKNEDVAHDTLIVDTPALDDGIRGHGGCTEAELYTGIDSDLTAAFPIRSKGNIPETMEDFIRTYFCPRRFRSDYNKPSLGQKALQVLRHYCVGAWYSEPYHQHQNKAENKMHIVKRHMKNTMNRYSVPGNCWLLVLLFVVGLLNVLASSDGRRPPPLQRVYGQQVDVSAYMTYHFWELVYYTEDDEPFPSKSEEKLGRWLGPAENVGDFLTYKILSLDTMQVLFRSRVRSAEDITAPNRKALSDTVLGEPGSDTELKAALATEILNRLNSKDENGETYKPAVYSPEELVGLTVLREQEDGTVIRATVERQLADRDADNHQNIKFILNLGDGELDELVTYNELSDLVERQSRRDASEEDTLYYAFREIQDHQGPLKPGDENYKGSKYNVLVHWEDDSKTWEPLYTMSKEDPITMAGYAKEHGLLDTPGWKSLNRYVRRTKKYQRMLNQAKRQTRRNAPVYKFGVQIPKGPKEAIELDRKNGNTLWQDANKVELDKLAEYNTFNDRGHKDRGGSAPKGYQQIKLMTTYDCKHDLRRRARICARGDMTTADKDNSYSSVVSLRGLRLAILIAELNGLDVFAADVSSAYLEAYTSEKVYTIAGPEFGELEGHILVIVKALYGLRGSGRAYWQKFAASLRALGFEPCKSEPDIWMRPMDNHYEYIAVFVDDLCIASRDPQSIINELSDPNGEHRYQFKGVGPITYHLGGNFKRDKDGTLAYSAQSYIEKTVDAYERIYGEKPKEYSCPLEPDDHPELDTTPEMGPDGQQKYQSLIGQLQWAISLCRFDIQVAVMSLSRFRTAPREGHLERAKRVVGYLRKHPDGAIRFRTGIPDYSGIEPPQYDWMQSVYGCPQEDTGNHPNPLGKAVRTTTFKDANLMHDLITGRSASGIFHMVNQTPVAWFSKRQNTVETATYGSEFVAARLAVEQIQDLRYTLRDLGVPLDGPAWLFGDNQSVVTSSTLPHSKLNKRHNALCYHKVREACAAGMRFVHCTSVQNVADVLTKFLPYAKFKPLVQGLLFSAGDQKVKKDLKKDIGSTVPDRFESKVTYLSVIDVINGFSETVRT